MRKILNKKTGIIVAASLAVLVLFAFKDDDKNFKIAKNIDIFTAIVKELDMFYVDTLDADKTLREGIDAMLYSLDPYTEYYPEENQSELEQMIKGTYGGIGSVITYDTKRKRSVIAEPYENMPAANVGLKAGDILLELDGEDLEGKTNSKVSEMLRGQVNTGFTLKVERPGMTEPLTFDIVRKSIELPTVPYYGVMADSVGYISLSSFSGKPSKAFKQAFLDLKENHGIASLIIDLRNNGGGLLDEAVEIANFFVPRGSLIVSTKGKIAQASNTYKTQREPIDTEIPLVILVNNGTASSSEILAGALQDMDRAVVVGTRTFGKGLVQVPRSLPYGGMMKLTTSKYYTPSGRCVQAINYQDRNDDGSVARIPDSLTNVFRTAGGRIVRDGGGITPDRVVKSERTPNIIYYLINDNLIFDYATKFVIANPTIGTPEAFEISDEHYAEFKTLVKESDFTYDKQSEKVFKSLKEFAEFEGYLTDASEEFAALEKKLQHNIDRDLDYFSKDIKQMLAYEIIKRYYYQRGAIIQQLKDDDDMDEAMRILTDMETYHTILSAAPAEE